MIPAPGPWYRPQSLDIDCKTLIGSASEGVAGWNMRCRFARSRWLRQPPSRTLCSMARAERTPHRSAHARRDAVCVSRCLVLLCWQHVLVYVRSTPCVPIVATPLWWPRSTDRFFVVLLQYFVEEALAQLRHAQLANPARALTAPCPGPGAAAARARAR